MSERANDVYSGAAVYSRGVLRMYDLWVVYFSNTYVWRCRRSRLLERYNEHLGARHLDVGPGTGWYLAHAERADDVTLTLMDLNANSLASTIDRLTSSGARTVRADVLQPLPDDVGPFDSIGINFVLHCVPGSWSEKGIAFGNLAARLAPGGVLFGSTVIGLGVRHNLVGRSLMSVYNDKGIFHNRGDDADGLERVLREYFQEVTVDVVGTVALFRASVPT